MVSWAIIKPISRAILKELGATVLILFIIAFSVFILLFYSPNEDMLTAYLLMISENMPVNEELDLDNIDFTSAFILWITAVLSGNFGLSLSNGLPAMQQSIEFMLNTISLIFFAVLLSLVISLPFSALIIKNNQPITQKILSFGLNCLSFFPLFWLAYLVIFLSGRLFDHFPLVQQSETSGAIFYLLPVILLAIGSGLVLEITQQVSYEVKRVSKEDYIICARAKGASVFRHLFKEGIAFPLLTLLSNRIAYLFGATIIIEQIFNWPGIGRLLWQTTQSRDLPLLLSAVLLTVLVIRIVQFMSRMCYVLINPRASHE